MLCPHPRLKNTKTLDMALKSVLEQKIQMILMPTAVQDPLIWRQGNRLPFTGGAIHLHSLDRSRVLEE